MTNETLFMFFRNMTIFLATIMVAKYFVFLVFSAYFSVGQAWRRYRLLKSEVKKYRTVRAYQPIVSVIIPAWNEEVGVLKTLKSVVANKYLRTEIIVVNDGSTDHSRELVDAYIDEQRITTKRRNIRQYYI